MIYRIKKLLSVLLISIIVFSSPMIALAYSYNHVFENVPPAILKWACPLPPDEYGNWRTVTSNWNTPRDIGTNPHQGVDLSTIDKSGNFKPIYAVWDGWLTRVGNYTIRFQIDINSDGIKNDPPYYCYYYHLSDRYPEHYYERGDRIGTSGDEGGAYAPHLHFGGAITDSYGTRWYRNEVNYRWTSYWCNGEDLDSFKQVRWNWDNGLNTAQITIYFMDDPDYYVQPSEVRIFHRKDGTSIWTDGGLMTYKGNNIYEYSFYGKYPSGTTINWLVRIKRSGVSGYPYCWAPAKYDQPDPNPNSTYYPYAYYTNTIH